MTKTFEKRNLALNTMQSIVFSQCGKFWPVYGVTFREVCPVYGIAFVMGPIYEFSKAHIYQKGGCPRPNQWPGLAGAGRGWPGLAGAGRGWPGLSK